jgi:hypothetical protein
MVIHSNCDADVMLHAGEAEGVEGFAADTYHQYPSSVSWGTGVFHALHANVAMYALCASTFTLLLHCQDIRNGASNEKGPTEMTFH